MNILILMGKTAVTVLTGIVVAVVVAWLALWGLVPNSSNPIEAVVNLRQSINVVVDAGDLRADFERVAGEGGSQERIEALLKRQNEILEGR